MVFAKLKSMRSFHFWKTPRTSWTFKYHFTPPPKMEPSHGQPGLRIRANDWAVERAIIASYGPVLSHFLRTVWWHLSCSISCRFM